MSTDNARPSPASAGSRPFPKVSPDRLLEILRMNCESGDILCGDAADEIERLRSQPCPYVTGTVTRYCTLTPFTLTDEEREAMEIVVQILEAEEVPKILRPHLLATLRGLLKRTK